MLGIFFISLHHAYRGKGSHCLAGLTSRIAPGIPCHPVPQRGKLQAGICTGPRDLSLSHDASPAELSCLLISLISSLLL